MENYQNLSQPKLTKLTKTRIVQFFVLVVIIIFVTFIASNEYKYTMHETRTQLNDKIISLHFETFAELSRVFEKDTKNQFIKEVEKEASFRDNFEDMLRLLRISTVQNLFVVTRDAEKNYYFLLDSERNPQKRANINEPFNPLGDYWDRCYKTDKPQVFHHHDNKDLWISVAYPIVENNKTVAIIGADISNQLDINMQMNLKNFTEFFFWILILSILWFILLYIMTLYFRRKYYEGYKDPLTQIYHRKYLYDILIKKLGRDYQLFMIDIDFFKKVNDTYGHNVGDYILQEVSNRMQLLIRDEDSLIRYGGEEFLIYTTQLNPTQCLDFAQRIRESIAKTPIKYKEIECQITISIGVNAKASSTEKFDDMLKKADDALYKAKLAGRNCVRTAN
jgi:diguanylate cyclase (GGDEF)-like protein